MIRIRVVALATCVLVASGCADEFRISSVEAPTRGDGMTPVTAASGRVLHVPDDHATIQSAVDAAEPGDLVLVSPGVYREGVSVGTPSLVIRGTDRNSVVVEGDATREVGVDVTADGVALENLSVRNHTGAGIRWRGVTGFRASFVTAWNNADHGIAAIASRDGLIEESYTSGSTEAGVAIARCDDCEIVVRRIVSSHNAIGLLAVDVVGPVEVRGNTWRHNRSGVVIASDAVATGADHGGVTIASNLFDGNVSLVAPYSLPAALTWGNGVTVMGSSRNVIEGNHISSHAGAGVLVVPSGRRPFSGAATQNLVTGNVVAQSGRADISVGGPAASTNCIDVQTEGTRFAPASLGCRDGTAVGTQGDLIPWMAGVIRGMRVDEARSPAWQEQPEPPAQPAMPEVTAAAVPALGVFVDSQATPVPSELPEDAESVSRAAIEHGGLPIHTWPPGVAVSRLQARAPFTLPRLFLALALLAVGGVAARAAGDNVRRAARRAWAVVFVAVMAWVGLACAAAVALSV